MCGQKRGAEARAHRVLSGGLAFVVGILVATFYLRIADRRGVPSCTRGYVEAQSAADTALVDAQPTGATTTRLDGMRNTTCGELRLRGELP